MSLRVNVVRESLVAKIVRRVLWPLMWVAALWTLPLRASAFVDVNCQGTVHHRDSGEVERVVLAESNNDRDFYVARLSRFSFAADFYRYSDGEVTLFIHDLELDTAVVSPQIFRPTGYGVNEIVHVKTIVGLETDEALTVELLCWQPIPDDAARRLSHSSR